MSKLIYITEAQLHEIVTNGAYYNPQDTTNEYRLGGAEISADGITGNYTDGDVEYADPTITDRIAKQIRRQGRNYMAQPAVNRRSQIPLPESNQDLAGKQKTFQISQTTLDDIRERLSGYSGDNDAPGVKRAKELLNTGRISYDNAYRTLNDYEKGIGSDILGAALEKEIRQRLNTAEDISQSGREAKMNRGENVLKSTNKTGFKGGAHTPSGNNTIGVTYEQ